MPPITRTSLPHVEEEVHNRFGVERLPLHRSLHLLQQATRLGGVLVEIDSAL